MITYFEIIPEITFSMRNEGIIFLITEKIFNYKITFIIFITCLYP